MKDVVKTLNPSAWRKEYGSFAYDVGFTYLTLEQRKAGGAVHTYYVTVLTLFKQKGLPEDFEAVRAAAEAVVEQTCRPPAKEFEK